MIFGVGSFVDITPPPKGSFSLKTPGAIQLAIAAFLMTCAFIFIIKRSRTVAKERAIKELTAEEEAKENVRRHLRFRMLGLMFLSMAFQIWG